MIKENDYKPRCLVLPFQENHSPGTGLALHFLLSNVIAAHIGFKECWFGWRMTKIFPQPEALKHYCQGRTRELDLQKISAVQDVQCWIYGRVDTDTVELHFFNARADAGHTREKCAITFKDHLVGFRQCFLAMLERCDYPISQDREPMMLWPEILSPEGLHQVGRALETFYFHSAYGAKKAMDLGPFEAAVKAAPESFMAHDLLGWACYRRQEVTQAKTSFLSALVLSPHAIGPMAGLMGCAVLEKDRESLLYWAARKAQARSEDVAAEVDKACKKLQP